MKKMKRFLCVALALAFCAGLLAGCGKKNEESQGSGSGGNTAAPEYVYVAQYIPIQGEFTTMLRNGVYANGFLYYGATAKVGDETPEGVEPEYEGQYWVYGPVIYKVGLDGACETIPYTPETVREADIEPETPDYVVSNVNSGSDLSGLCVAADGTIWVVERTYCFWFETPEGMTDEDPDYWSYQHSQEGFTLRAVREDGTVLRSVALDELGGTRERGEGAYYSFNLNGFEMDGAGNLYLAANEMFESPGDYRDEYRIYVLDGNGEVQFTVEPSGYVSGLIRRGDAVAVAYYDRDDNRQKLADIDPAAKALGEGVTVSGDLYSMSAGGGDYDFYYTSGINFYGYDLESGEQTKILNWLNCDVDTRYGNTAATVLDDGRIVTTSGEWEDDRNTYRNELILLTPTPYDQVPRKETLTLATQSLGWAVRSQIIDFNKNSDRFHIDVTDYSEYNDYRSEDEADWTAGLTKLKTEIMSGNVPDLLDLSQMPVGQFAAKGILEDLYPYIDGDPELSRGDLMENVLAAFERDGKLYNTLSTFYILTAAGPSDIVGDKPGWTMDQFSAAFAELKAMNPEATAFDQYVTRDDMLRYCLYLDMDSYVNWDTGECSFDSPGFVKLLEFVKSFPTEFDWENYEWSGESQVNYRIANGLQMLSTTGVSDFEDYQYQLQIFQGRPFTFIGFPTEYGTGNMFLSTGSAFGMTSKCANKEAAWEFLRQFFTEDYQEDLWGLRTNKNAFEKKLKNAMTVEYQRDENGNYLLDEDGNRIEVDRGSYWANGEEVKIHALTQDEADQIMELINTTTKTLNMDESMTNIVKEGAAPFFEGQRGAEDVAKQIQSKAILYVNEKR